jgi:hypothetical protein
MSPLDAENLGITHKERGVPIVDYQYTAHPNRNKSYLKHAFLENLSNSDLVSQAISISSLERLGLVTTTYSHYLAEEGIYSKFEATNVYKKMLANVPKAPEGGFVSPRDDGLITGVEAKKGILDLTPLGRAFSEICLVSEIK